MFCDLLLQVVGAIGVTAYVIPWVLIPIAPSFCIYASFAKYFRSTSRELQRLESVSRAPVFAQVIPSRLSRVSPLLLERAEASALRFEYDG